MFYTQTWLAIHLNNTPLWVFSLNIFLSVQQKYFDSGDYNMAKAKMKNKQLPSAPTEKTEITGGHIPTPQDLPQRKTSIVASKLAGWWFYVHCFVTIPTPHFISTCCLHYCLYFTFCMYSLRSSIKSNSWGKIGNCRALNCWVKYNKAVADNVSQDHKKRLNSETFLNISNMNGC